MHCCLAQAAGRHALCSQSCSVCSLGHALLPGQGSARYAPRTPSRSMCSLGHCCLAEFVRASGQDKHSWHPLQGRTSASAGHNVLSLKQQSLVKQDTLSYYLGTKHTLQQQQCVMPARKILRLPPATLGLERSLECRAKTFLPRTGPFAGRALCRQNITRKRGLLTRTGVQATVACKGTCTCALVPPKTALNMYSTASARHQHLQP